MLYITESNLMSPYPNGGEVISKNNLMLLNDMFPYNIEVYSLHKKNTIVNKIRKLFFLLLGQYYPATNYSYKKIEKYIILNSIDCVYIDNSKLGLLCYHLKKNLGSNIKIITYFHNDEVAYLKDQNRMALSKYIILRTIKNAQKHALALSNTCLFISSEEMTRLGNIHIHNYVLPITLNDNFISKKPENNPCDEDYLLFLGSSFPPNIEAVKWLKKNVMPYISYKLLIVGKNFEQLKNELECDNIKVIGSVDSTDKYIRNATLVLSPIFSGAGMKIKIAESLMYGKKIIANKVALSGYDINHMNDFIIECNDAESFIKQINFHFPYSSKYYVEVRNYFLLHFSKENTLKKFGDIIERL